MHVSALWLTDFRSYPQLELDLSTGLTAISGPNGVGKTNLLEAIGLLATLKSFRGAPVESLIRRGATAAVIRAEGTSEWRTASHDEFALVVDGEVVVDLLDPDELPAGAAAGSVAVDGEPAGTPMGRITAGRGHMALLPAGRCYRFSAERPGVILLQTLEGPDTVYRWAEICQTA